MAVCRGFPCHVARLAVDQAPQHTRDAVGSSLTVSKLRWALTWNRRKSHRYAECCIASNVSPFGVEANDTTRVPRPLSLYRDLGWKIRARGDGT